MKYIFLILISSICLMSCTDQDGITEQKNLIEKNTYYDSYNFRVQSLYEYNSKNQLTHTTHNRFNSNDELEYIEEETNYKYLEDGRVSSYQIETSWPLYTSTLSPTTEYVTYDYNNHQRIGETNLATSKAKTITLLDENDRPIEVKEYINESEVGKRIYSWQNENIIKVEYFDKTSSGYLLSFERDKTYDNKLNPNKNKSNIFSSQNNTVSSIFKEYNSNSQLNITIYDNYDHKYDKDNYPISYTMTRTSTDSDNEVTVRATYIYQSLN
ncbi:hypothetical protein [Flammeovirga agarivorans]|uniref:Uncharacterized protein n=1 Tax=Flammeovirga agarivorans TaxID=2726742 RepID=A0A7X8SJ48_9BACT|nr:hypothetical protein [Flammeovirga agarivorans]NLR91181.1 hypothetical protein [Flammeovirga agarivorans]